MTLNNTDLTVRRNELATIFDKKRTDIASLMPGKDEKDRQAAAERLIAVTKNALIRNPDLYECSPHSVVKACMMAAQDGLVIDGREAALVSFKGTASYIPMVRGLLKLAYNTGQIASVQVNIVYANDKFHVVAGDDEKIEHEPVVFGDKGAALGVYAIIRLKDGGAFREIMSKDDVEAVRNRGQRRDKGPWATDWGEMCKKTVVKRLLKRLPFSGEKLTQVIAEEDEYDLDIAAEPVEQESPKPRRQSVAETVNQAARQHQPETTDHDPETGEVNEVSQSSNQAPPPVIEDDGIGDIL